MKLLAFIDSGASSAEMTYIRKFGEQGEKRVGDPDLKIQAAHRSLARTLFGTDEE